MSSEALGYALKADIEEPLARLVLVYLADSANVKDHYADQGHITWHGTDKLARALHRDRRGIRRYRSWLIEHGYIREAPDQGIVVNDPKYPANHQPVVYQVAVNDQMRDEWAANQRTDGIRASAVEAGKKGPARRGVTPMSPQTTSEDEAGVTPMSPLDSATEGPLGVTPVTARGDTDVTQTSKGTSKGEPSLRSGSLSDDSLRSSSARPAETQQPLIDTPQPAAERTPMQIAEGIAKGWVERRRGQGIPVPNARQVHMAVRGYAKSALEEGVTETQVKAALDRAGETLPSMPVWRRALEEVVTGRQAVRPWQRGEVGYRDAPGVNEVDMRELFGMGDQ